MSIIRRIYKGTEAVSTTFVKGSIYDKAAFEYSDAMNKIENCIPDKADLLEDLDNAQCDMLDIVSYTNYEIGFRDGARIMLDILYGKNENFAEQKDKS